MRRIAVGAAALVTALVATDIGAQSSQESGLHIMAVSSPSPGGIQVLVKADAATDKKVGASPAAKDFTLSLSGGAAQNLTVARNGGRGKPLTTIVALDLSPSYKRIFAPMIALPAIYDYGKDGSEELGLIVFSLNATPKDIRTNPNDFMKDVQDVKTLPPRRATSVTVGLGKAIDTAAKEGEPGLREVVVFTDGLDEADVDKSVWADTIAHAKELGVRVSVSLPPEDLLPKPPSKADYDRWVTTTTNLNRIADETGGVNVTSKDPAEVAKALRAARVELKAAFVVEGKLCGAQSGQAVNVRVEYATGGKREAWSGNSQLPAAAWAPGSEAKCPSLCTPLCSAWEDCVAGTCAALACTNDSACTGGAVCVAGFCGKQCSPLCANWQECKSGGCAARTCAGDESCGAGSTCTKGMCTAPKTKSSGKLIWILAGAGGLLLIAALFVLLRKKPVPPPITENVVPAEPSPEPAPVEKPSAGVDLDPLPETHLVAIGGWTTPGERWRLHKRKTIAGGSSDPGDHVDLVFGIKQVSSRHAQFELFPSGNLWVTDLGSSNGTFVNGKKLAAKERTKLVAGDQVKLSQNLILVVERPGSSATDDEPAGRPVASPSSEPEKPAEKPKAATKFDPGGR